MAKWTPDNVLVVEPPVTVRIPVPAELFRAYEIQAKESSQQPEEIMARRLSEFVDQDTFKGRKLLLSPAERQELEKLFSRSFKTGSELLRFLTDVYSLRIGEVRVPLGGSLLQRLKDRCGLRRTFPEFVSEVVVRQLEHFTGLR